MCVGWRLSDVPLPSGWEWNDPDELLNAVGGYKAKATYVPSDPDYAAVEVVVTVTVTEHTGGTATCLHGAVCSVCGKEYGEKAPHRTEKIPAVSPSCTTAGSTAGERCMECGEIVVAPVTGHSFGEWTVTKEPTQTEDSERSRICVSCGKRETERIPALVPDEPSPDPDSPVTPMPNVPDVSADDGGLPAGAIAGIAVGSVALAAGTTYLALGLFFRAGVLRGSFFDKLYPFFRKKK